MKHMILTYASQQDYDGMAGRTTERHRRRRRDHRAQLAASRLFGNLVDVAGNIEA